MSTGIAVFENIILKKGNTVLQPPLSLTWKKGQQWCVTGPTGSGKTLFLRIIAGLSFAPGSKISYQILEEFRKKEKFMISDYIGFVPQKVKIPAGYIQDLYYQRRYQSAEQDDIPTSYEVLLKNSINNKSLIDEVSKLMNLNKLMSQPFVQLSNGQTRRLMIALALLKNPKILILDNPYTGLDHEARESLNRHIKTLIGHGVHIFMAAHEHELNGTGFVTNILKLKPVLEISNNLSFPSFYISMPETATIPVVQMENIRIVYGENTVLNIPHWEVKPYDRWVIQGKNGSGKSILLSLITADHPQAYSNKLFLFGKRRGTGESIWDIKKRIGYFSPELLRYFPKYPPAKSVIASGWSDFAGQIPALTNEKKALVNSLSEWLGISSLLNIRFGNLSLGQQKMILIARAMVRNPEVLILDEPLQGMDAQWRNHFKSKIDEFTRYRTALYVTHDEEEIPGGEWQKLKL